jgi:hypothetical protein
MLAAAVWHLPLGILGLVYDQTFPVGATAAERASSEHVLGICPGVPMSVFTWHEWRILQGLNRSRT